MSCEPVLCNRIRIAGGLLGMAALLIVASAPALGSSPRQPRHEARPRPQRPPAQRPLATEQAADRLDPSLFAALHYRHIGPYRGGRVTAVTGVPGDPFTYYMGSTGGGVWKTDDGGGSWRNLSDGTFEAASMGALAVAPSDPNVVYAGTGSADPRGNVSPGVGLYRSTDAGETWTHVGLRDAGQIGKVVVDPRDPDLVYVAVLGHVFGPNEQRGVFRSRDGGASWDRVLYLDEQTGFVDLSMNARNPRVLYAAAWRVERKPWTLISGGPEPGDGGIYKSVDGGDTWDKLSGGLPERLVGKIGVAVSPADPDRVYAIVEAERKMDEPERGEAGFYRSDDAGRTWRLVNDEAKIHQRPWYYHHVTADPRDPDTVWLVGDDLWRSVDAGRTFEEVAVPHADNHDLWINPDDPRIMIEANDGGANVTFNGGRTWSTQLNQPTAEIYRVAVDEQFPYRVYGGQQDNSTISLPSRALGAGGITLQHWTAVGGGESAHVAVDPRDPDVVYAGTYAGRITRMDRDTGQVREVMDYPIYMVGKATRDLPYRFQWNAPIRLSPHDPEVLYHTSQFVHRSTNGGQSWEVVSPDLTRDEDEHQGYAGGPLTRDITGVEVYGTIFVFEESPLQPGLLWAGSDDGLVHVSRDAGETWVDVTPPDMPEWGTVNTIEPSPHDPARAVIAVQRYRFDDFRPYVFRTDDMGASWTLLTPIDAAAAAREPDADPGGTISGGDPLAGTTGIPRDHFVRVVREDPDHDGLLYAGTEFGMYVSFDGGRRWQPFQLDLPVTPITDLAVHRQDLVVATQGRGFWILDDLTPLHQIARLAEASGLDSDGVPRAMRSDGAGATDSGDVWLFEPRPAYRLENPGSVGSGYMVGDRFHGASIERHRVGENPPAGAMIFYWLERAPAEGEEVTLEILEPDGDLVRRFSSQVEAAVDPPNAWLSGVEVPQEVPAEAGLNRFVWDLHYPGAEVIPGGRFDGYTGGPWAVPATYTVRLGLGDGSRERPLVIRMDPRTRSTPEELREQFDFLIRTRDRITETHDAVRTIHAVRRQLRQLLGPPADSRGAPGRLDADTRELGAGILARLDALEDELRQRRSKVYQDTENFEPLLDSQFAWVAAQTVAADARPTDQARERLADLEARLADHLAALDAVLEEVAELNRRLLESGWQPVRTEKAGTRENRQDTTGPPPVSPSLAPGER